MKEKITIGFLTSQDQLDKKSWSGIYYRMFKGLSNEFDNVLCIGPIKKNLSIKIVIYILDRIHLILFSKGYNRYHNILLSKYYSYKIEKKIRKKSIDVLFAPAGSAEIAFIKTSIPICYLSDTTFGQINNYYKSFSNLSNISIKESNLIEQRAISNSIIQVFSSKWASDYAINNYKCNKENVYTINFGANIDQAPKLKNNSDKFLGSINFLFLGVDWERKGGDITLTICGCHPPQKIAHPNVKVIPFLNKNIKNEYDEFLRIMHQTHLLFVPTRADCTPIVFCEANAFGIPVVMSLKARIRYDTELNWDVWSKRMRELLLIISHKTDKIKVN